MDCLLDNLLLASAAFSLEESLDMFGSVVSSVTRFGKILPLWQNLKILWLFFEGLFCIGQNFKCS